jgi:hypothetical protein
MKTKKFDCIKVKHEGTLRIYQETKDLTLEQELAYWQRKDQAALIRQAQRQKKLSQDRKANPRGRTAPA